MRKNKFLAVIMLMLTLLLTLTSCESIKSDKVDSSVKYEIVTKDGVETIKYKVVLTNSTIYNFSNVSYELEMFNGETSVGILDGYAGDEILIDHGKSRIVEGEKAKPEVEFTTIKVVNYKYTPLSFYDTYSAFIILMPIITVIISGIVVYILLKNDSNAKPDSGRTSVIGLIGLLAMLSMINYIGWIPILSMFIAAALIFLSGYVAVLIKKHRYVPQEVLDAMSDKASNAEDIIDAEAIDTISDSTNEEKINDDSDENIEK